MLQTLLGLLNSFSLPSQSSSSCNCSRAASSCANTSFALLYLQVDKVSSSWESGHQQHGHDLFEHIHAMDTSHRLCPANPISPCMDAPGTEKLDYTWHMHGISHVYHLSICTKHVSVSRTEPIDGIHGIRPLIGCNTTYMTNMK